MLSFGSNICFIRPLATIPSTDDLRGVSAIESNSVIYLIGGCSRALSSIIVIILLVVVISLATCLPSADSGVHLHVYASFARVRSCRRSLLRLGVEHDE